MNLTISSGTSVEFIDDGQVQHTATSCSPAQCSGVGPGTGSDPPFNSGDLNPGSTFTVQLNGLGTYNYYCMIHGYQLMHGTIIVIA
jgi:plastocyanin